jgi:hypothetical protein
MDAGEGAIIGSVVTAVIAAAVAAVMKLSGLWYDQSRTTAGDRRDEYEAHISRLEKLYQGEHEAHAATRAEGDSVNHQREECERRLARLEAWAVWVIEDMTRAGVPVRALPTDGGDRHRPLPGSGT